jgi:polar amino acid transport system substrate-binding protein
MRVRRAVAAGAALCGALAAAPAHARDLGEIKDSGRLRVLAVVEEKEPEFLSLRPGGSPGFDREILEGFASSERLQVDYVVVPTWDALVPALLAGKGDLIAGRVSDTPARRKLAAFTVEVFPTRIVAVTRRPRPPVADPAQLAALKIGTIPGTSMAEAVAALGVPAHHIVGLSAGGLSDALSNGRVEAVVWAVEGAILAQRKDPALQLGAFLGAAESLAYGVRREDARLLAALNEHIRLVKQTGTWNRLVVKYFGNAAPDILNKARRGD